MGTGPTAVGLGEDASGVGDVTAGAALAGPVRAGAPARRPSATVTPAKVARSSALQPVIVTAATSAGATAARNRAIGGLSRVRERNLSSCDNEGKTLPGCPQLLLRRLRRMRSSATTVPSTVRCVLVGAPAEKTTA